MNASSTANPVTGAGGVSLATMGVGGAFGAYPAATFTAASDKVTANFGGSAFAGVVPAGFTSGFTSGAAFSTSALVTQVTVEQWATTATIAGQAIVTQVALEQWVPAAKPAVELAGNLGGAFQYGKLAYGKGNTAGSAPLRRSSRLTSPLLRSPTFPATLRRPSSSPLISTYTST